MGRPRTTPDAVVLEAAALVFRQKGAAKFTLAHVANEVGLAPATLIHRFGSKRGLLLAIARVAAEGADASLEMIRATHRSPLSALFAYFDHMAQVAETPETLANSLAFLQIDLTDPEFRRWTLQHYGAIDAAYQALLEDAIAARELKRCDVTALSRLITATLHGALISWALVQEGTALAWLRRDMEALLAPYRAVKGVRSSVRKKRRTALVAKRVGLTTVDL